MHFVIIGNGVAGITAAETIRNLDADAEISVISTEKHFYYSRPRVIEFLGNKIAQERLILHNKSWYDEKNIKLSTGACASRIDEKQGEVIMESGEKIKYDRLIIATGAYSAVPQIENVCQEGVFTLRTIDDANGIKEYAKNRKSALVLGAGLLGIEAANSLTALGLEVKVAEIFERLLPRQLDKQGSMVMQSMLESKGLSFFLGKASVSVSKQDKNLAVKCKDGSTMEAEMILISAGIKPNTDIIKNTAIQCNRGIKVDNLLKTNCENIFAAGDCAEYNGTVYGIWPAAKDQGYFAGLNASGRKTEYVGTLPSVKLKVMGIDFVTLGSIEQGEGVETIVKQDKGIYKKLCLKDNKLTGAILLGDTKDTGKLQEMINKKQDITFVKDHLV